MKTIAGVLSIIVLIQAQGVCYAQYDDMVRSIGIDPITPSSWSLSMRASINLVQDSSSTFGVKPDATANYDELYDVPRPPDPPGDFIEAYFPHSGSNWPSLLGSKFAADYMQPEKPRWLLEVNTTFLSGVVTLSWDTTVLNKLPAGYNPVLKDSMTGTIILMRSQNSYSFSFEGLQVFSIWIDYSYSAIEVYPQWNMISIPRTPENRSTSSIFPTAISKAFSYDDHYISKETLEVGIGYWLKFNERQTITISGLGVSSLQVPLNEGWNMIGSIDQKIEAPEDEILSTGFFEYTSGYGVADTLEPGRAYWVKSKRAGSLLLTPNTTGSKALHKINIHEQFNKLILTDSRGNRQELYYSAQMHCLDIERYELPPIPPEGTFDARFQTGRNLEILSEVERGEYTIQVSAIDYPLTLQWEIKDFEKTASVTIGNQQIVLKGTGIATILHPVSLLTLTLEDRPNTPRELLLEQNYPNPFNPSTIVRYSTSEPSLISFTLFDLLGKERNRWDIGLEPPGWHAMTINGTVLQLESGVYYFTCRAFGMNSSNTYSKTNKIIFVK